MWRSIIIIACCVLSSSFVIGAIPEEQLREEANPFTLTIVMGPLCSGKTSYIERRVVRNGNASRYAILSVDAIIDAAAPQWKKMHGDYHTYRREYGDQALMHEFYRLIRWPRQHLLYETTGADHAFYRMLHIAREAHAAGYRVDLVFHAVTPDRVARCVRHRNRIQARQVSPEDMKRIYFESHVNFARLTTGKRAYHRQWFDSITVVTRPK